MRNIKKSILSLVVLPIASIMAFSNVANAETIRTKNFQIQITNNCEEGNVTCDNVTYVGKALKTGKSIRLTGRVVTSGKNYNFVGYEFRNGEYTYFVTTSNVRLQVYKGKKLIIEEQGTLLNN
jgi:hypothetical protein